MHWRARWISPASATKSSSAISSSPPTRRSGMPRSRAARRWCTCRARPTATFRRKFRRGHRRETQLVAITHVCFRNGAKLEIPGIVRIARAKGAHGAARLLPGGRLAGHRCQGSGCRFRGRRHAEVSAGHGGHRLSCMFADSFTRSLVPDELRLVRAGGTSAAMDITANRPHPSARRFEAGTPAVVNCYASEAGLKFLSGGRHAGHREAQPGANATLHGETRWKSAGRVSRPLRMHVAARRYACPRATAAHCPRSS